MNRRLIPGTLRMIGCYFRFNLSAGMAYRGSFIMQVFGMALNNSMFIVFWRVLYNHTGNLGGWGFTEVMFLWALVSIVYGLGQVLAGNIPRLSRIIYTGDLDVYLTQPKPVVLNIAGSRMDVSGWGDILYGLILFFFTQTAAVGPILLFLTLSFMGALAMASARIVFHSLSFWLGNAEGLAIAMDEMLINFTLYPPSLFPAPVRAVLTFLVPSALVAWYPAEIFQAFSFRGLIGLAAADIVLACLALGLFRLGLKRYSSGNRMGARL